MANMTSSRGQRSYNTFCKAWNLNSSSKPSAASAKSIRIDEALELMTEVSSESSPITPSTPGKDTVLYLAYGSNLAASVFEGVRGIKPLNQRNVLVPELELCFDLPGIPYNEPCFANTRIRNVKPPWTNDHSETQWQRKWEKGLVGVVYEVTKADYATIIATEGGGSSYQDVVVLCFEIPRGTTVIQPIPRTIPFKAHTLFSPSIPPTKPGEPAKPIGRVGRPDPDYAQASQRYLKLMSDGSAEHSMPLDYQNYLLRLEPYTITSTRQKIGKAIFQTIWMPLLLLVITLGKMFADEDGKIPAWLAFISNLVFGGIWMSYDKIFKPLFGDGERTQKEDESDEQLTSWDEKKPLLYDV